MNSTGSFIRVFAELGRFLGQFRNGNGSAASGLEALNSRWFIPYQEAIRKEASHNPWFTAEMVTLATSGIAEMLDPGALKKWLAPYPIPGPEAPGAATVGLVMAGNIPLVGFHDLMCVLAAGHRALARPSSKDDRLIRLLAEILAFIDPETGSRISFAETKLEGMDAVIATGSDNSARYFNYYFREIPHVIRRNRNGVAVLTGEETPGQLQALGMDIFAYFGLGCRNVTKLYIPENYDLASLLDELNGYERFASHHKYSNNVAYYRSIYLMNRQPFLDSGFLILKEETSLASPVGVVYYERYSDIGEVLKVLEQHKDEIQCIASVHPGIPGAVQPGNTQRPMPWEYADGVDTMKFLLKLSAS